MSEESSKIKNKIAVILDHVNELKDNISGNQKQDFMTRLQYVRNTVMENEKKIWLRTKKGKEMISELSERTEKLFESIKDTEIVPSQFENILHDMEERSKKIVEEVRKRSMVVT
jgi:uncharacterized protein with von Willebrand factor type A (vWA) domain